jgi:hypothetical protein
LKNLLNNKIIIGTRSLAGDLGKIKKKQIFKTIEYSISKGFNYFDTAPFYGKGMADDILTYFKNDIIVDTKCGYNLDFTKKTFKASDIKKSLELSLKKFEKINVFYIHNPRNEIRDWSEIISLMNSFKKKKLIKFTGISLARGYLFNQKILNNFDVVQDDINILRSSPLDYLKNFKGKIISRSVFASGCLSGKLNQNSKFDKNDYRFDWLKKERLESVLYQISEVKKIFKGELKKIALGYILKKKVNKIIIGIKKKKHKYFFCENDFKIDKSIIKKIDHLNKINFYKEDLNGY